MELSKKTSIKCNIITLLFLFMTFSFDSTSNIISSSLSIIIWIGLFCLVLSNWKISIFPLIIFGITSVLMLMSTIINGEDIVRYIKTILIILVGLLYISAYDFKTIRLSIVNVVSIFAILSLPFYFTCLINLSFFNNFLVTVEGNWRTWINLHFFNFIITSNRNSGFCWEPGAFVTLLCIALSFVLLANDVEIKRKKFVIVLLICTIITTFSTTGYICLSILLIVTLLDKRIGKKTRISILFITILLVVLCATLLPSELFDLGQNAVFGKIIQFVKLDGDIGKYGGTVGIRLNAIVKPFEEFLNSPLFGVGYDNLQESTRMYTAGVISFTPINWFAIYGVFWGLFILIGYIKFISNLDKTKIIKILLFFFFIFLVCSENYCTNSFILCFSFMGYKNNKFSNSLVLYKI